MSFVLVTAAILEAHTCCYSGFNIFAFRNRGEGGGGIKKTKDFQSVRVMYGYEPPPPPQIHVKMIYFKEYCLCEVFVIALAICKAFLGFMQWMEDRKIPFPL